MSVTFGVVTNCWSIELAAGRSLSAVIGRAVEAGFGAIELRQGSLGECEERDSRMPELAELAQLKSQFPGVAFDLAAELPLFSQAIDVTVPETSRLLAAAQIADGHLRIVDLKSRDSDLRQPGVHDMVSSSVQTLLESGRITLVSIEHSLQSWHLFHAAFSMLRSRCGERVRLCFDPCNLWLTNDGDRVMSITDDLPPEWLSMLHLKQRQDGRVLPTFGDGEVPWREVTGSLIRRGYSGPVLFELSGSDNADQELAAARQQVEQLLRKA